MSDAPRNFFAAWRKRAGLTQVEASVALEWPQSLVSSLERGSRRYNEDHLTNMAKVYGCEPWELVYGPPEGATPPQVSKRNDLAEVVEIWDHISDDAKDQAKTILKTFITKEKSG